MQSTSLSIAASPKFSCVALHVRIFLSQMKHHVSSPMITSHVLRHNNFLNISMFRSFGTPLCSINCRINQLARKHHAFVRRQRMSDTHRNTLCHPGKKLRSTSVAQQDVDCTSECLNFGEQKVVVTRETFQFHDSGCGHANTLTLTLVLAISLTLSLSHSFTLCLSVHLSVQLTN